MYAMIPEFMKQNNRSIIERIRKTDFEKEFRGEEFEIKFSLENTGRNPMKYLEAVVSSLKRYDRYIACHIPKGDMLFTNVRFFLHNGREHTIFRYKGARMIKVKKLFGWLMISIRIVKIRYDSEYWDRAIVKGIPPWIESG